MMSEEREVPRAPMTDEDLPDGYLYTPGGNHVFTMTPGGTIRKYDRASIKFLSMSPISRAVPRDMVSIPGITSMKDDLDYHPPDAKSKEQSGKSPEDSKEHMGLQESRGGEANHSQVQSHVEEHEEDMIFPMD